MLNLNSIINIIVNFPSQATATENFGLGLIIGKTSFITKDVRVKLYSSIDEVMSDGFSDNSALLAAATLYFSQSPQPTKLAIGVQYLGATKTITTQTHASPTLVVASTTGMSVGDLISGTGIPFGTTILSKNIDGVTLTLSANATIDATSGSVTYGFETATAALTACRSANSDWYIAVVIGAATSDIEAMAAYVESASPATILFYTTADSVVLAGSVGNLCSTLQAANYSRTLGQYSSVADAVASIMGYACGASDQAYDLDFKGEPAVTAEVLTSSNVNVLKNENCNYLTTYNSTYTFFSNGVMADGSHFDEVLGIDMLTADIQAELTSLIMSSTKVPMTDAGMAQLTTAIAKACDAALKRGFIAAGTWDGASVLSLQPGTALTNGYSIQAGSISDLSSVDKAARVTPPIYVCIILAGSGESFTITANVNR